MRRDNASAPRAGGLVWFRRDLRDFDHAALAGAHADGGPVHTAFVFDRDILDPLPSRSDRRVEFILESVRELDTALRARGGGLIVRHGFSRSEIPPLADALRVEAVYANRDYEPATLDRDAAIEEALAQRGVAFLTTKDQVIRERDEVTTQAGTSFGVFTPYKRAWLASLTPVDFASHVRRLSQAYRSLPGSAELSCGQGSFVPVRPPPLRHRVDTRAGRFRAHACARARWRGRGNVAVGARVARVLFADPLASAGRREAYLQGGVRRPALSERSSASCSMARRAHRLPDRRRSDAAAQYDGLHAQSPAHPIVDHAQARKEALALFNSVRVL